MGIYSHIPRAIFARKKIASAAVKGSYKLYTTLTGERPFLSGLEGTNLRLLKRVDEFFPSTASGDDSARRLLRQLFRELLSRQVTPGVKVICLGF